MQAGVYWPLSTRIPKIARARDLVRPAFALIFHFNLSKSGDLSTRASRRDIYI